MTTQNKLKLLELLNEAIACGKVAVFDVTGHVYETVVDEACENGPQIKITIKGDAAGIGSGARGARPSAISD